MIQHIHKRFVVGIDRAKMRLYDCEQKAQEDIIDNGQETEYDEDKSKFKKHSATLNSNDCRY